MENNNNSEANPEFYQQEYDERPAHRFLIVTVGTRGDVQPYLALANRLISNGHEVGVATHSTFESFVFQHGHEEITFCPLEGNPAAVLNDPEFIHAFFEGSAGDQMEIMKKSSISYTAKNMKLVHNYVQQFKPTAIITGIINTGECISLGQRYCLPVVVASTVPIYSSKETVPIGMPMSPSSIGAVNKALHWVASKLQWTLFFGKLVNEFRRTLNLPEQDKMDLDGVPVLHMYSSLVFPIPRDWPPHCLVTGYWVLPTPDTYDPPNEILDYLSRCEASTGAPVYIGFGSMPIKDKKKLIHVVGESLKSVGKNGIFCTGWAGDDLGEVPENIFVIKDCPHEWLFPRCSVIVHHGGAGTTAASCRAGVPTIVFPVLIDQPFWAQCIIGLNIGQSAICHLKDINSAFFSEQLQRCLTDEIQQNAKAFAARLLREDGTGEAVSYIVGYCNQHINPGGLELNYLPDSATATCLECKVEFTFMNRRHHCMSCGRVLCGKCVKYRDLPNFGNLRYCCESCCKKRHIKWQD